MRMYELSDTIELMTSDDYKERFKAEYWQTKIRHDKLHDMIVKYEAGTLNFEPTCNIDIFKKQDVENSFDSFPDLKNYL